MAAHPTIVGVSDVSIGFGSPQIPLLMQSLAAHYRAPTLIFEPDQSGRPPVTPPRGCTIARLSTAVSPYSEPGRVEYIGAAAQAINTMRPAVLVLFCTFTLPVVLHLRYRPRCIIYVSVESIAVYGQRDVDLNREVAGALDLIIFPEENRARLDGAQCGLLGRPLAILYNCANEAAATAAPVPAEQRLRRILYSGKLDRDQTQARYFLGEHVQDIPIDIFGAVDGEDAAGLQAALSAQTGKVRYYGLVPAAHLASIRKGYAYSIVMWAPTNDNQRYAAPNKFFEAIADGVPPITAPHPQCKMLVERYQCGIVMEDWSYEAFRAGLDTALALFGSERYASMVANCARAVRDELNWEAQFAKVVPHLPEAG
jgi:hypothetical protein